MGRVLEQHGTALHRLKPGMILQAAAADLKRFEHKRDGTLRDKFAPYAFHRDHVRAAHSPHELIEQALEEQERGLTSGKRQTRMIYGARELLWEALAALREGRAA